MTSSKDDPMLISLGYSCQTRFMIDALHAGQKRLPFDFNITSRPALIKALATDGVSLEHAEDNATPYLMPVEGREGIEVSGMYFWHDYPLRENKLSLSHAWREDIERVNAKYRALWARFSETVRSDTPKTFVLTNSQHNLPQFASDTADFDRKFGLGRQAYDEIVTALDAYGARNYSLRFLSRLIGEVEDTASLHDQRLDHRFVGVLSLRIEAGIVNSLFAGAGEPEIHDLHGDYDDGEKFVRPISDSVALIFKIADGAASPWGSLSRTDDGFVAAFEGRDQVFKVMKEGSTLRFSNGETWERSPAGKNRED